MVNEAIQSSAIEGEFISRIDLISSIKKNLGFETPSHFIKDKRSAGFARLLVYTRETFQKPLTEEMLFEWHRLLMEASFLKNIGRWRNHQEPMQIISGSIGKEIVHFEALPSAFVGQEMSTFINWFNDSKIQNPLVKSAIAHLYFESIHPFENGNGRIGRLISEKALSMGLGKPLLCSISTSIEQKRNEYYKELKKAQQTLAISDWITWFCEIVLHAQQSFEELLGFTLKKTRFFDKIQSIANERQQKVIGRMLQEGEYFEGGMSSKKYMSITKTSKATATRDLQDLKSKGIFVSDKKGRGTNYQVNFDFNSK